MLIVVATALLWYAEGFESYPGKGGEAYVTHMTSDDYVVGAEILAHSLHATGTSRPLLAMTTSSLHPNSIFRLKSAGYAIVHVNEFGDGSKDLDFSRGFFTKLEAWRLPYSRVIYLDTDILITRNIDHLFQTARDARFCAVPDSQPHMEGKSPVPNTGLMLISPSNQSYIELKILAERLGSPLHDIPFYEQGLIGTYFENDWTHLPPIYNFCVRYMNRPLYDRVTRGNVAVVHYAKCKPWDTSLQNLAELEAKSQGFLEEYRHYITKFHYFASQHKLYTYPDGIHSLDGVENDMSEEVHNQRKWARLMMPFLKEEGNNLGKIPMPPLRADVGGPGPRGSEILSQELQRLSQLTKETIRSTMHRGYGVPGPVTVWIVD